MPVTIANLARPAGGGVSCGGPESLTKTAQAHGALAYMSPEQLEGREVDARSDQFSFCVAFYEALAGVRPFAGTSHQEMLAAIRMQALRHSAPGHVVPKWLLRVLKKGLQLEPAQRFASMEELLLALRRDPVSRYRRLAVAAAVLTAIGASVPGYQHLLSERSRRSPNPEPLLVGVWGESTRAKTRQAFLASSLPYAAKAFDSADAFLGRYLQDWLSAYAAACEAPEEATVEAASRSTQLACLEWRLLDVAGLEDVLGSGEQSVIEHAVDVVEGLEPVAACAQVGRQIASPVKVAVGDEEKRQALAIQTARAVARAEAGLIESGNALAQELLPQVRELGESRLEARLLGVESLAYKRSNEFQKAVDSRLRAAGAAALAFDDQQAFEHYCQAIKDLAFFLYKPAEASEWLRVAEACVARLGRPPRYEAELELLQLGVRDHNSLSDEESVRRAERAVALLRSALGPGHGGLVDGLRGLTAARAATGDFDGARSAAQEELDIKTKRLGERHPKVVRSLSVLALLERKAGRWESALQLSERARSIALAAYGPNTRETAEELAAIGQCRVGLHDFEQAAKDLEQAISVIASSAPGWDSTLVTARHDLAVAYAELGKRASAIQLLKDAIAASKAKPDNSKYRFHHSLWVTYGDLLLAGGEARQAVHAYQVVLEDLPKQGYQPDVDLRARASAGVARAQWESGRNRAEAWTKIVDARESLASAAKRRGELEGYVKQLDEWLAARRSPPAGLDFGK